MSIFESNRNVCSRMGIHFISSFLVVGYTDSVGGLWKTFGPLLYPYPLLLLRPLTGSRTSGLNYLLMSSSDSSLIDGNEIGI